MATNLAIDDKLLERALKIGGQRTKKATVTQALLEYIERRDGALFVAPAGDVEEQVGGAAVGGDVAELVQNQQVAAAPMGGGPPRNSQPGATRSASPRQT